MRFAWKLSANVENGRFSIELLLYTFKIRVQLRGTTFPSSNTRPADDAAALAGLRSHLRADLG